jgi:hypothetical protein
MNSTSRRRILTAAAASSTAILAGCSGGESLTGDSGQSNLITELEVTPDDEETPSTYYLGIGLVENHNITKLAIQNPDGSVRSEDSVDSAQTKVYLPLYNVFDGEIDLEDEPYKIIAYNEDSVEARSEWIPEWSADIGSVEVGGIDNDSISLYVNNTGNVAVTITDAYISDGYTVREGDDQAGEMYYGDTRYALPDDRKTITIERIYRGIGADNELLPPPSGSCQGTENVTITVDTSKLGQLSKEVTVEFGGEENQLGPSCEEVTIQNSSDT